MRRILGEAVVGLELLRRCWDALNMKSLKVFVEILRNRFKKGIVGDGFKRMVEYVFTVKFLRSFLS